MTTLRKLIDLLTPHERKRALLLLSMVLIMALLDVVGVASIMPLMAVLGNPEMIKTNPLLALAYKELGFTSTQDFMFFLGGAVFILLVFSLAFKAMTTFAQLRFTLMREYSIGCRLIEGYLHQPYTWFLNQHSADLGRTVLSEVGHVINGAMQPMMVILAQGFAGIAIILLLVAVDPELALIVGMVLGVSYLLIFQSIKEFMSRIGSERAKANQARFTVVSEAFGASKEVKVGGLEQTYIQRFSRPAELYARHQSSAQIVAQFPRYALEAIAFGGMILLMLFLMKGRGDFATVLPIIALYAFAGYRLIPALQQIYGSFSQLRFAGPALDALHAELISLAPTHLADAAVPKMKLEHAIQLRNIQFSYPKASQPALKGINLNIPAYSTIGLIGSTGSGKTTMVDLILGLLEPQQGSIFVDDKIIDVSSRRQWQKSIGYVPQQIYLADDSVAANIAFGLESSEIDQSAVEHAAMIANLHDFVVEELPQGYDSIIGERGVRLSGGQRQRIGIARSLYHNPQVLILDEATSALDNLTELAVMEAVNNLSHEITIILIAHRLSTVRQCDQIYLLKAGQIIAKGTYDQLKQENQTFRQMVGVS